MNQEALEREIDRVEEEAEAAKKKGNYEIAFLKYDIARRLREKLDLQAKAAGGLST